MASEEDRWRTIHQGDLGEVGRSAPELEMEIRRLRRALVDVTLRLDRAKGWEALLQAAQQASAEAHAALKNSRSTPLLTTEAHAQRVLAALELPVEDLEQVRGLVRSVQLEEATRCYELAVQAAREGRMDAEIAVGLKIAHQIKAGAWAGEPEKA